MHMANLSHTGSGHATICATGARTVADGGTARRVRVAAMLVAACLGLFAGGCRRETPTATQPPERDSQIALATPQDAAASVLGLLHRHLQAVAKGDREEANRLRDQVVWHIAAQDEIVAAFHAVPIGRRKSRETILTAYIENWASIIAYYADGFELDRMKVEGAAAGAKALVQVPAHGPDPGEKTIIGIACQLNDQEDWRVIGLEFLKPTLPSSQPSTRPTQTQPAGGGE